MKRRELLQTTAALGLMAAAPRARAGRTGEVAPLHPPAQGTIPVAFLLSDGAVIIDFCGPWAVFQSAMSGSQMPFKLYTVAETTKPIRAGGMQIVPDYDFATAPLPKVLVIPAQSANSEPVLDWIRRASRGTDVTMSVCTGAFLLARTGLLAGKPATTHHGSFATFAMQFPDVRVRRGARFVEAGNLASAGGLTSGIDLALHVVERYFGREVATRTAYQMEYQGQGWLDPDSNHVYAHPPPVPAGRALCPVCWMEVDPAKAPKSVLNGTAYYFCMEPHKERFDSSPQPFLEAMR